MKRHLLLLASFVIATQASGQWSITSLGVGAEASGVTNGSQIGSSGDEFQDTLRARVWHGSAGSAVNLNPQGAIKSRASGGDGEYQVGSVYLTGVGSYQAALWRGTAESFVNLNPTGVATWSYLNGVRNGMQVGGAFISGAHQAGVWTGTAGSYVNLGIGSVNSAANGTDGVYQVGHALRGGKTRASLWQGTANSWVDLDPGVGTESVATGIDSGKQSGYVKIANNVYHASLWSGSAASWVDLNPSGAVSSRALSTFGNLQGGFAQIDGRIRAGVWNGTAGSWEDLSGLFPSIAFSNYITGVWSDSQFVYLSAYGRDQNNSISSAFVLSRPVPEPTTLAALALAAVLLKRRR